MASATLPKGALWMQNVNFPASWDRGLIDALYASEGVIDGFVVTPDTGLTINVSAGRAVVTGDEVANQGKYLIDSDATVQLTVASVGADRTEYVYLAVNDTSVAGGRAGNNVTIETSETPPADSTMVIATLTLLNGTITITSGMISDDRVFADVVAPASIDTAKLADGSVTTAKIGDDQVTQPKIAGGAVGTTELASGAITTAKIGDNQVTTAKIGDDQVTQPKIGPGAVDTTELADDAVTQSKIGPGAVGTTELASDAVTQSKIGPSAVGTTELANNAVTSAKINAGAVGASEIASSAVGTSELADNAVTSAKINAGAVGASEIASSAVGSSELASSAVTEAKIAADAVTLGKIDYAWAEAHKTSTTSSLGTTWSTQLSVNISAPAGSLVWVNCFMDVEWEDSVDTAGDLVEAEVMYSGSWIMSGRFIYKPTIVRAGSLHRHTIPIQKLFVASNTLSSVQIRMQRSTSNNTVRVLGASSASASHSKLQVAAIKA